MTHPALKNNHEIHKASIVKWYCPNLMGSDTSNYPPWCCWHQWTFINTRALAASSASTKQEPTWLSSSHWEQTKHVSVQWVHYAAHDINASVDIVTSSWHCHASRDTAWLSCITPHGHTSNKPNIMVSFPSPHWSQTLNAGLLLAASSSVLTRYLHNFSFISAPWLGPAQYTGHNEYSSPEEWSACDVWLLRYSNIKCDNNDPRDITAASLCVLPLV